MNMTIFNMQLKMVRNYRGLIQAELGEKLAVSSSTVAQWEVMDRYPETPTLIRLAEVLDVSIDYLLTGKEPRNSQIVVRRCDKKALNSVIRIFTKMKEELE